MPMINIKVGEIYGRWTVIDNSFERLDTGNRTLLCRCECGTVRQVIMNELRSGRSQSCGCMRNELASNRLKTHGMSGTRIYRIFQCMKDRCYSKSHEAYFRYGGRGIIICDEWLDSFENFYNWAISHGYRDSLSIDRIDNNGNYEPKNCKWSTTKEQNNNRKNHRYITYDGKTMNVSQWANYLGLPRGTLQNRISAGKTIEEVLSTSSLSKKIPLGYVNHVQKYSLDGTLIETYMNLKDAAESVNGIASSVQYVCDKINRTYKGFKWKYIAVPKN